MGKNTKTIIIAVAAAAVLIAGAVLLIAVRMNSSGNSSDDPEATPSALSQLDKFMCISVTVGADPSSDINICFETLTSITDVCVEYGPSFSSSFTCDSEDVTLSFPADGEWDLKEPTLEDTAGYVYRAHITGLTAGTSYSYRIKGTYTSESGKTSEVYSDTYTFTTEDTSSDDFSFIYVTDSQGFTETNFNVWGQLIKAADSAFPDADFILHTGDTVEDGKNQYQWYMYFGAADKILENKTVIQVGGNQDKQYTFLHYTCGAENDNTALSSGYFSFDYGNVHFTVIYTGDGEKDLSNSQVKWIKKDLKAAAETGKTMVVLMHKAPYSDRNHACDEEIQEISEQVMPLFYEYGVDVVIEGHDHYYYLSEPIAENGEEAEHTYSDVDIGGDTVSMLTRGEKSTVYFMNGAAGVKQHDGEVLIELHTRRSIILDNPTFSYVTVDSEKIVFKTYRLDSGNLILLDAWGMYLDGN